MALEKKQLYDVIYWDRYQNTHTETIKATSESDAEIRFYKKHWRDLIKYTKPHKAS